MKNNFQTLINNIKDVIDNNDYTPLKSFYTKEQYNKFVKYEKRRIENEIITNIKDYIKGLEL